MAKKDLDFKKAMGVLAVIFGILIIVNPAILSIVVGAYLIITGVANLLS